jgi:hypothetical protein
VQEVCYGESEKERGVCERAMGKTEGDIGEERARKGEVLLGVASMEKGSNNVGYGNSG